MTSSVPPVGRGAIVVLSRRTQALDWDAHREGRRYMVDSDELLSAFLELEATLRGGPKAK